MKHWSDKPRMNLVERPAVLDENGDIRIAPFSLLGGKTMRLDLRKEVNGTIVLSMGLLDEEVDAMRQGIVQDGVFYVRNFSASAVEIEHLGHFLKRRGPKKKAAEAA